LTLSYTVREATLADSDALVHHRIAMFTDMGVPLDAVALDSAFRVWLAETMPSGAYRAWVVEDEDGAIVGGGGMTILPWPPGPRYMGNRLAFVYNVYVEHAHRRRGLARRIMDAIHAFCRGNQIVSVALNASHDGVPLYKAMGYVEAPAPMMFFAVSEV
jgi:GNAT superfamily N-acetyltransferase